MQRFFDIVFFDLGDTLLYFDGNWGEVMDRALHHMVLVLSNHGQEFQDVHAFEVLFRQRLSDYYISRDEKCIEFTTERVLRSLIVEMGLQKRLKDRIRLALNAMYTITEERWMAENDSIETLENLKNEGYHLGLISNAADTNDVFVLLEKTQLHDYFEHILVSADFGLRKPHSKIFKAALKHWNARAEQAVMVGDTLEADVLGARKVGMASVWITRRVRNPKKRLDDVNYHPDAVISSLTELVPLLRNWPERSDLLTDGFKD